MAEPLVVIVPHRLGRDAAKERLQRGLTQIRDGLARAGAASVEETWSGDEMSFRIAALGQVASGRIEIEETSARVEVFLPGMLGWLGRRIAERIRRDGGLLLENKRR
jgi:hypothetical protein